MIKNKNLIIIAWYQIVTWNILLSDYCEINLENNGKYITMYQLDYVTYN